MTKRKKKRNDVPSRKRKKGRYRKKDSTPNPETEDNEESEESELEVDDYEATGAPQPLAALLLPAVGLPQAPLAELALPLAALDVPQHVEVHAVVNYQDPVPPDPAPPAELALPLVALDVPQHDLAVHAVLQDPLPQDLAPPAELALPLAAPQLQDPVHQDVLEKTQNTIKKRYGYTSYVIYSKLS